MPIVEPPYKRDPTWNQGEPGLGGTTYTFRTTPPPPERAPPPLATYWLLGVMVAVFVLELAALAAYGENVVDLVFTISWGWWLHPWQLVTSTVSHGGVMHLFFNGLFFYFFAPTIERILGRKKFLVLFFVSGAVTGVAQVHLPLFLRDQLGLAVSGGGGALGASGALMALFGISMILMPDSKMIMFPIFVPVPLWFGGLMFAALDVAGAFSGSSSVGNFAHLVGLGVGLLYGIRVREDLRSRGLRIVRV